MNRIIRLNDHNILPWKNGRSVTREIYKIDYNEGWIFRVSSAKVSENGPFSDYAGYDRTIVNLGSGVMTLSSNHEPLISLRTHEIYHFDGGLAIDAKVSEPLEDFNVFCRKDVCFASTFVRRLSKPEFIPVPPSSGLLIYVLSGALVVHDLARREYGLVSGEAIVRDPSDSINSDRWMLAKASEEECQFMAVSFRIKSF
jgi:environmental stress-induced protein Ves